VERADGRPARRHHLLHLRRQSRPAARTRRTGRTLWRFAADLGVTFFGAGAAFFANCMKAGVDLAAGPGCAACARSAPPARRCRKTCSAGARAQFERLGVPDIWWCNISGGTDFAGAFIGGNRELPQVPGQMQCRCSARGRGVERAGPAGDRRGRRAGVHAADAVDAAVLLERPGNKRYLASYFDTWPGVWRHGDWLKITPEGGCIIYGRSDATINRHGLRMGTSELYSAVEALPEVLDSMVVDLEYLGRESYMPLFVVLRPGVALDDGDEGEAGRRHPHALSPRFVPDEILQVPEIPRTLSGKKQELPIKKLLLGQPIEKVVNRDAMANPGCLDWYVQASAAAAPAARGDANRPRSSE
jgi:acetoacetyl-CoA synthetase